jgi:predicted transcriptional regulator
MINTEKVVQHAGSHRILHALSMRDCTSKELKNIVGAINSISKFDGEYMARMFSNGYVLRSDDGWTLTDKGRRKFDQLGPARGMPGLNATARVTNSFQNKGDYKGETALPLRPGAEDFLKLPSRIGNTLYFRDGHKEQVNE